MRKFLKYLKYAFIAYLVIGFIYIFSIIDHTVEEINVDWTQYEDGLESLIYISNCDQLDEVYNRLLFGEKGDPDKHRELMKYIKRTGRKRKCKNGWFKSNVDY